MAVNADFPSDIVAAATHPDPYPYYAHLVAHMPFCRDETLGVWVAASADAVTAVLTHELCRVRPVTEPVPPTLAGSPAADIFRQLIRMNDGSGHCPLNRAVGATLASIDSSVLSEHCAGWASYLLAKFDPATHLAHVSEFAFQLSPHVIGSLLGLPDEELHRTGEWVGEFVRCVFGSTSSEEIERGKVAAGKLWSLFRNRLDTSLRDGKNNLLVMLAREAERVGRSDQNAIIANAIGFLSQAYEATAGLISNTMLALASRKQMLYEASTDQKLLRNLLLEVLRYDPPNHTTRRFVVADGVVLGEKVKSGDTIIVALAAANRDPTANPQPERFDLHRENRRLFTFGTGIHAC